MSDIGSGILGDEFQGYASRGREVQACGKCGLQWQALWPLLLPAIAASSSATTAALSNIDNGCCAFTTTTTPTTPATATTTTSSFYEYY